MRCVVAFLLSLLIVLAGAPVLSSGPGVLAHAQDATPEVACPVTTEEENAAIALRWHEDAINGGDLDVIDDIVAPNVVHHAGTFPDGVGPEAVKTVLGALLTAFPDVHHTVERVVPGDDFVTTIWQAEGTHEGEFQGYAPAGKRATWTGINVFRFECGRIAEEWSELDGIGRLRQLGLLATPTP